MSPTMSNNSSIDKWISSSAIRLGALRYEGTRDATVPDVVVSFIDRAQSVDHEHEPLRLGPRKVTAGYVDVFEHQGMSNT